MNKIAIISDIHGNIPALEAVLDDIKTREVDRIINLGDLVGKGPSSKEVIDICKINCDIILKGNWDDYLCNHEEEGQVNWYRKQIGVDRLSYLNSLPLKLEFYLSGKLIRLFHAHPKSLYKRMHSHANIDEKREMFRCEEEDMENIFAKEADIVGYADIHCAYLNNFNGKTLFNVGSVGNPLDIAQASYVLLEGTYGSQDNSGYSIQFYRVPYDIELAVHHARKIGQPKVEAYINEVRTAEYSR